MLLNTRYTWILIVPFLLLSCTTTETVTNETDDSQSVSDIERPIPYPVEVPNAFEQALQNNTRSSDGTPGENYWQNEATYTLNAELDPETHTLFGQSKITYQNNSPNDLEVIVVELAQNLHKEGTPKKEETEITGGKKLTKISLNGTKLEETTMQARWMESSDGYILEGTRLYIFPQEPAESGSSADLEFEWSFEIPQQGASGRMGRSRDNLYMLAYWYPQVAVFDDVYGWMDDSFVGNAEFYHNFSDYDLTVTAPENWIVMGTGEFLNPEETLSPEVLDRYTNAGESDDVVTIVDFDEVDNSTVTTDDGMVTWRFQAEQVRDVAFSATRQSKWEGARTSVGDLDQDGETDFTRINTFYRDTAPLWSEQTDYAQHSTTFLSDYTEIPYPWPHMTSVEGADIIGGGMEFPMITLIGDYNNAGPESLYGVTAHEIAHMWIPMIVSTNERRYTWIDEGHTSFHTQQANVDRYGYEQFPRGNLFGQYLQIAGTDLEGEMIRWSDFHYPGPAYGVASYPKPASVLTALRGVLGEDLFNEAHTEFMERWEYKHPYPWDFFNTVEDVTGEDLSWFWRSWYYETWVLDQSIADVQQNEEQTIIEIEDIGNIPMPVHLEITFEDGSTRNEVLNVDYWLEGHRTREYSINTSSEITKVEIDPETLFPDADRSNNIWEK
ncbi:MAG: M1 family metallopeptidase [Balneolaceae bacterium]